MTLTDNLEPCPGSGDSPLVLTIIGERAKCPVCSMRVGPPRTRGRRSPMIVPDHQRVRREVRDAV